jgi:hypothetical protein
MMAADSKLRRRVEYYVPDQEAIDQYARFVCEQVAERRGSAFCEPEVIRGLAEFMKIAGTIQAKYLNRANQVDNNAE